MGHTISLNADLRYRQLQRRLDRMPTGAPDTPTFRAILRLLFSPEEAELAARMPTLCSLTSLARTVGRDVADLDESITRMAARGVVFDIETRGERWVMLAPVVVGFYETTFMHVGENTPPAELVHLFDEYLHEAHAAGLKSIFRANVQIMRALVREEALPDDPGWRCSTSNDLEDHLFGRDGRGGDVSMSAPRPACRPRVRRGAAHLSELQRQCRGTGAGRAGGSDLHHRGRRHRREGEGRRPGADRGQRPARRRLHLQLLPLLLRPAVRHPHDRPRWRGDVQLGRGHRLDECRGCKKCFRRCPVEAITVIDNEGRGRRPYWSIVDPIAVSAAACARRLPLERPPPTPSRAPHVHPNHHPRQADRDGRGARQARRPARRHAPGGGPRTAAHVLQALERTPAATALRAIEPLRSVFLRGLLAALDATVGRA